MYVLGLLCRTDFRRFFMARKIQRTYRKKYIHSLYLQKVRQKADFLIRMKEQEEEQKEMLKRINLNKKAFFSIISFFRMFVINRKYIRVRTMVRSIREAAVRIQKFWRTLKAVSCAVEYVCKLRRLRSSTFAGCSSPHSVLTVLEGITSDLYSVNDPRVGLGIVGFFHRLGE